MTFSRPYLFPFKVKNAGTGLLCLSVFMLVPILSFIVILGYRAILANEFEKKTPEDELPGFTFDKFSEYINRGIAPFVFQLIQIFVWGFAYGVSYFGVIMLMVTQGNKPDGLFIAIVVGMWAVSIAFFHILTSALIWPFVFHGMIRRKIEFGNAWKFAKEFYGLIGWSLIGVVIPKFFIDIVVILIGYLCCLIGYIPAYVVVILSEQHFISQLYNRYLERGGTPIPPFVEPYEDEEIDDEDEVPKATADSPEPERSPKSDPHA